MYQQLAPCDRIGDRDRSRLLATGRSGTLLLLEVSLEPVDCQPCGLRSDLRRSQAFAQAPKDRQLAPTNQLGERTAVEIESRLLVIDDEQSWGMDPRQRGRGKRNSRWLDWAQAQGGVQAQA